MIRLTYTSTVIAIVMTASCQSSETKDAVKSQQLSQEAIRIHDEIMPQISDFDKKTLLIDSLLEKIPATDTSALKNDLTTLKANLEAATDNMMTWMHDYQPDSSDISYQTAEIERIKAMSKQFEEVTAESNKKLNNK